MPLPVSRTRKRPCLPSEDSRALALQADQKRRSCASAPYGGFAPLLGAVMRSSPRGAWCYRTAADRRASTRLGSIASDRQRETKLQV